jgi:energy-coupling factor transport system permease protein
MTVDFSLPGTSLFHRLDPRAKLFLLAVFVSCFFIPVPLWAMAATLAVLAILIAGSCGPRELGKAVLAILPVLLVIVLLTPFVNRGGEVLWAPFGWKILTSEGLSQSLRMVLRFTGLTLAFFAVFRTLDMNDMVAALRWYGLPFKASLVTIIALRFIPTLFAVYGNVQDAHTLRRGGGRSVGFFGRSLPVLTSVFIQAIRGIPSLAMALEMRGFGRKGRRSVYRSLPTGAGVAVSWVAAGLAAAALYSPLLLLLLGQR